MIDLWGSIVIDDRPPGASAKFHPKAISDLEEILASTIVGMENLFQTAVTERIARVHIHMPRRWLKWA
jgi:hypothetical protein